MEYIGVQIYICKSGVSGVQWVGVQWGTVGYKYGVQIYICKSGVSGVHWDKWGKWGNWCEMG